MAFPAPDPIHTERLTVRRADRADLPDLLDVHDSEEVTHFLPYARWATLADAESWFQRMQARQDDGDAMQFVVVERAAHRVVGTCLLFRHDPASARAELGYVLGRRDWGRGLMREALRGLLGLAFGPLGLRRIEADVDPRNVASSRLLLALGFIQEGHLRQRWLVKGELRDSFFYGLLKDDWLATYNDDRTRQAR